MRRWLAAVSNVISTRTFHFDLHRFTKYHIAGSDLAESSPTSAGHARAVAREGEGKYEMIGLDRYFLRHYLTYLVNSAGQQCGRFTAEGTGE